MQNTTPPDMLVVVAEASALQRMITEAVHQAFLEREAHDQRPLSAVAAARIARRRTAVVLSALESGALPGHRNGRAWHVMPRDVAAWREKGCPVEVGAS